MTVTETIAVIANDEDIKHGILRDFPTTYTDKLGRRVRVGFAVTGVTMYGAKEQADLEGIEDGQRIKIGDPDTRA